MEPDEMIKNIGLGFLIAIAIVVLGAVQLHLYDREDQDQRNEMNHIPQSHGDY